MTEASNQGIALPVAMALSDHTGFEVAASYYRDSENTQNSCGILAGRPSMNTLSELKKRKWIRFFT